MCKPWFEEVKWKICVCKPMIPYIEDAKMVTDIYLCTGKSWKWASDILSVLNNLDPRSWLLLLAPIGMLVEYELSILVRPMKIYVYFLTDYHVLFSYNRKTVPYQNIPRIAITLTSMSMNLRTFKNKKWLSSVKNIFMNLAVTQISPNRWQFPKDSYFEEQLTQCHYSVLNNYSFCVNLTILRAWL